MAKPTLAAEAVFLAYVASVSATFLRKTELSSSRMLRL